jgi:hypothetical protein
MKPIREIARQVHASLFSTNLELQTQAITLHYAENATFDDPIVSVSGLEDIQAQFRFLTYFSQISTEISSVLLSTTTSAGLTEMRDLVIIDALVTFRFLLFSLPLRQITRFEFNDQSLIVKHEDIWSLKHTISNVPVLGWIYEKSRLATGLITSKIIRKLGIAHDMFIASAKNKL